MTLYPVSRELTFTGVQPFDPRVLKVRVGDFGTVIEPSATASATTEFI